MSDLTTGIVKDLIEPGPEALAADPPFAPTVDLTAQISPEVIEEIEQAEKVLPPPVVGYDALGEIAEDSLRLYLAEAGRTPLLKAEQEQSLAKEFEAGRNAESALLAVLGDADGATIAKHRLLHAIKVGQALRADYDAVELDPASVPELVQTIRLGELARRKLVESNLRLVVSIARKYVGRGLTLLDLIQEGNIGLMRAIEKFDWRRGFKLSTYATWWIRQAISRAVADQARTIRLPVHLVDTLSQINQAERRLTSELSRPPTEEEIAESLELPLERVQSIRRYAQPPASLDKVVGDEEGSALGDLVPDDRQQSPFAATSSIMLKDALHDVIGQLSPRERAVLDLRYGLTDDHPRTLEEVGKELGVTRERIRQIEAHAIRKLRHPSRSRVLRDFLAEVEE
jgi:RNA polymerase primary sigma factor